MLTTEHPMSPFDKYFFDLGEGGRIDHFEIFKSLVGQAVTEPQSLTKLINHFWQAARAASMVSGINQYASQEQTKQANKYLSKKMTAIYGAFPDALPSNPNDLEKMMGLHVRLQTIPRSDFTTSWIAESQNHMDELNPEWFRTAFENFTKLGVYPGDEWIENWWTTTPKDMAAYQPTDLYRILYRLAGLDFIRRDDESLSDIPSPPRRIAGIILDDIERRAQQLFPEFINNQVFFAGLWFGKDFVTTFKMAGDDGFHSSVLERKVMQHIADNSNVDVSQSGIIVPVTGHKIDLRLDLKGTLFGSEVDGISHFNRMSGATPHDNAVVYNPSTRFHSWMIAEYLKDMSVLRIPYFMFDATEAGIPWEKTLGKITRKEQHGIYAWHGGSQVKDMERMKNSHIFLGHDL